MSKKSAAGESAAPKARAARAKKGAGVQPSVGPSWEAKMAAAKGPEYRYTMTAIYRIGDILLHAQFGKGIVLKLAPQKCHVLFQDQERLMASANASECVSWPLAVTKMPTTRR